MKIDKILTLVNIYAPNNDNPTFFKIFSIKSSLLNVKKLLWEATLIWSWTFRRIKKEETGQRRKIRLKKSEHSELAGPDRCVASPKSRRYAFHLAEN